MNLKKISLINFQMSSAEINSLMEDVYFELSDEAK